MAESSPGHLHNVSSQLSPLGTSSSSHWTRDRAGEGALPGRPEEGDSRRPEGWSGRFHLGSIPGLGGVSLAGGLWNVQARRQPGHSGQLGNQLLNLAPARPALCSPFPPLDPQAPFSLRGQGYRFNQGEIGELSSVEGNNHISFIRGSRESLFTHTCLKDSGSRQPLGSDRGCHPREASGGQR